jgi:two-component system chemotaxis sensor kinase CheA
MAVPLGTVARLEELSATQAETAGTQWVAQYRGQILPLVNLQAALEERRQRKRHSTNPSPIPGQPLQVVVCNHEDHLVGLMVEHILDIVEDAADLKYPSTRPGVLHSAVIQGKVTELIDVPAVLRASGISFATAQIQTGAAEEISQS